MAHICDPLRPFTGTYNCSGTSITDANDHGLGVLAARLGDPSASDAKPAAAITLVGW